MNNNKLIVARQEVSYARMLSTVATIVTAVTLAYQQLEPVIPEEYKAYIVPILGAVVSVTSFLVRPEKKT